VTEVFDATNEPLLTHAEVVELQRAIEAGLLACDARVSGAGFADATDQELRLLEERGALARQRFIRANLRLVGLVSRQFASRSQLGDAELFQEGCIGLPACQLPTGSSPCTSLSANSLIMLRSYTSVRPRRRVTRQEMAAVSGVGIGSDPQGLKTARVTVVTSTGSAPNGARVRDAGGADSGGGNSAMGTNSA
jgi:hypothetical protein